jgi:hypothetical protein
MSVVAARVRIGQISLERSPSPVTYRSAARRAADLHEGNRDGVRGGCRGYRLVGVRPSGRAHVASEPSPPTASAGLTVPVTEAFGDLCLSIHNGGGGLGKGAGFILVSETRFVLSRDLWLRKVDRLWPGPAKGAGL